MPDVFCWLLVLLRLVMASLGSFLWLRWAPGARLNSAARGSGVSGPAAAAKEEAARHDASHDTAPRDARDRVLVDLRQSGAPAPAVVVEWSGRGCDGGAGGARR